MYRFDGASTPTYALTGDGMELGAEFALGVMLRTTTTRQGALMGFSNDDDNHFKAILNEDASGAFKAGWVHVALLADGVAADVEFDGSMLFDGEAHRLVIRRFASDLLSVMVDDQVVVSDEDVGHLLGKPIAVDRSFAFGGFFNDNSIDSPLPVDVGEFWLVNYAMPSVWAIKWLLNGLSPRSLDEGFTYYWSGYLTNVAEIGGDVLFNTGVAVDHPIVAVTGETEAAADYGYPLGPRYEIFIGDGAAADPAVDAPVCVVPRAITAPSLYGTHPASTTVFVTVFAANATGRSESGVTFSFPTNSAGEPSLVPAVPYDVVAIPLAGGLVRLRWRYTETSPVPGAIAATFEVLVTQIRNPWETLEAYIPIVVAYQPGEFFEKTLDVLTAGKRYVLAVRSLSALGATAGSSVGAMVTVDASAPVAPALTLGAA